MIHSSGLCYGAPFYLDWICLYRSVGGACGRSEPFRPGGDRKVQDRFRVAAVDWPAAAARTSYGPLGLLQVPEKGQVSFRSSGRIDAHAAGAAAAAATADIRNPAADGTWCNSA